MRILKSLVVGLLALILSLSLAGMLASSVFVSTLGKPDNLKSWLQGSKIYSAGVNNIITKASTGDGKDSTVSQPEVQAAIKQTLTPEVAQTTVEQIIDGTYHWLEGKSPKPDFAIDLSSLKATFAENSGNAAALRLSSLPECTKAQLQQLGGDKDAFSISCRPAGLDIAAEKQKIVDQVLSNKDVLANPLITADSLKNGQDKPFYQKASSLPQTFQWLQKAPWIFGGLSLLLIVAIVWLSSSHRKGLRRVASSLLTTGITLILSVVVVNWLSSKATGRNIFKSDVTPDLQTALISFGKLAANAVNKVLLIFGIVFTLLGVGTLVYLRFSRPRKVTEPEQPKPDSQNTAPPQPPITRHPNAMG